MVKTTTLFIIALLCSLSFLNAQEVSRENIDASVAEHDKANIAMMKKDNETAYTHLKKAIELDPTNSAFLNSTAYMAMTMGEFDNSIKYLKKALELDKKRFGENHMNVASVLNNIASVYSKMGNQKEAINHYQQAYDLAKNELGETHPQSTMIKALLDKEMQKD